MPHREKIPDQNRGKQKLGVQPAPALKKSRIEHYHGRSREQCRPKCGNTDRVVDLAFHHLQDLDKVCILHIFHMVHKEPRHVKEHGKPGHHRDDMKPFYPEIIFHFYPLLQ